MTINRRCLSLLVKAQESFANLSSMSDLVCSGLGQSFDLESTHFLHPVSDVAIGGIWKLQGSFSRSLIVIVGRRFDGLSGWCPVE